MWCWRSSARATSEAVSAAGRAWSATARLASSPIATDTSCTRALPHAPNPAHPRHLSPHPHPPTPTECRGAQAV
eukprot:2513052-Rhodomonas_salina.1